MDIRLGYFTSLDEDFDELLKLHKQIYDLNKGILSAYANLL